MGWKVKTWKLAIEHSVVYKDDEPEPTLASAMEDHQFAPTADEFTVVNSSVRDAVPGVDVDEES